MSWMEYRRGTHTVRIPLVVFAGLLLVITLMTIVLWSMLTVAVSPSVSVLVTLMRLFSGVATILGNGPLPRTEPSASPTSPPVSVSAAPSSNTVAWLPLL